MSEKKIWIVHTQADAAEASKLNDLLDRQTLDVLNSYVEHEVVKEDQEMKCKPQVILCCTN